MKPKGQITFVMGVISATILMLNNFGQALTFYGLIPNPKTLNWIAAISLLISVYYLVFIADLGAARKPTKTL